MIKIRKHPLNSDWTFLLIGFLLITILLLSKMIYPLSTPYFLTDGEVRLLTETRWQNMQMTYWENIDSVHECGIALQGWNGNSLHYQIENCYLSADGWHKYTMNVDTEPQIIAELPEGIYPNPTSVATIRQKRVSADGKYTAILLNEPSGSPELVIYVVD